MKAVIILRNGAEINLTTNDLKITKRRNGTIKRIDFDDGSRFVRFLNPREIVCALAYPDAPEGETKGDTDDGKKAN